MEYSSGLARTCAGLISAEKIKCFSPRAIAREIEGIIESGYDFMVRQDEICAGDVEALANYRRTAISLSANGLRLLAIASLSVMPRFAEQLCRFLRLEDFAIRARGIAGGHVVDLKQDIEIP